MQNGRRDEFFRDGPLEDAFDATHPAIDFRAAEFVDINHVLPNSFERLGAKILSESASVKCMKWSKSMVHALRFTGPRTVVSRGKFEIGQDHLTDGEILSGS